MIQGAPTEEVMGVVQKIFYFHVPCAWIMFLATFVSAGASLVYLFKRSQRADEIAEAAAELVVVFGALIAVGIALS